MHFYSTASGSNVAHSLSLKPSMVSRTLRSPELSGAWTRQTPLMQLGPASPITFVPRAASSPWFLEHDEEGALIAAVNVTGTLRDRTIITLLASYRVACVRTAYPDMPADPSGQAKRDTTDYREGQESARGFTPYDHSIDLEPVSGNLSAGMPGSLSCKKKRTALTGQSPGHVVTKYARLAQVVDLSPHNLRQRFGLWIAEAVPLHRLAHHGP
jgi:integrase/recombinase XerC